MDEDLRARFLLEGAGDAVKNLLPETVDIDALSNVTEAKNGASLQKLDDSIPKHGYSRIRPESPTVAPRRAHLDIGARLGGRLDTTHLALRARRRGRRPASEATDGTIFF